MIDLDIGGTWSEARAIDSAFCASRYSTSFYQSFMRRTSDERAATERLNHHHQPPFLSRKCAVRTVYGGTKHKQCDQAESAQSKSSARDTRWSESFTGGGLWIQAIGRRTNSPLLLWQYQVPLLLFRRYFSFVWEEVEILIVVRESVIE